MARKQPDTPTVNSPPVRDDFSLIKGIGPVLSRRLHRAGICSYNQLASLSPAELAEKIKGLSAKQIAIQDWTGQAHKLEPQKARAKILQKVSPKRNFHQHYENFTIEFLLDEKNGLRRTRVVHVQSGDADTWPEWEADHLIDFIARHAWVHVPPKRLEKPAILEADKSSHRKPDRNSNSTEVKSPDRSSLISDVREKTLSDADITKPIIQTPVESKFAGMFRLGDFGVLPIGSDIPIHSLCQDQPCHVRLTLDLANVSIPNGVPLRCKATIRFKQLGGASCLVTEETCTIKMAEFVTLDIICTGPQPGLYRPDAFVRLFSGETDLGLMASLKGELIQVF